MGETWGEDSTSSSEGSAGAAFHRQVEELAVFQSVRRSALPPQLKIRTVTLTPLPENLDDGAAYKQKQGATRSQGRLLVASWGGDSIAHIGLEGSMLADASQKHTARSQTVEIFVA